MTTTSDSENFKERVREKIDLAALIEETTPVDRRGRIWTAKCPFHDEKTGSLKIYPDQQSWYCYGGCQDGGDIFKWVMLRDRVDFFTALQTLAAKAGLEMPKFEGESKESQDERQKAQEMLRFVVGWYHERLLTEEKAEPHRQYLRERGFADPAMWERWQLGAAGAADSLVAIFQKRGFDMVLAQKIGLIHPAGERLKDHFHSRIIIPLMGNGKVAYITSRTILNEEPKYLHLKNSEFAHKIPFNANSRAKSVVVVEGPFDAFAVEALAGESNHLGAIGLMGLSAGDPVLPKALANRDRVFVGLDVHESVDHEKIDAVARVAGVEHAHILYWPEGKDPAEWLQAGGTSIEFNSLVAHSHKWVDDVIAEIDHADVATKADAVKRALEVVMLMEPLQQDAHISIIKTLAKPAIQAATIKAMVAKYRQTQTASANGNGKHPPDGQQAEVSYYQISKGEMWLGGNFPKRIARGGAATYTELVEIDDGENVERQCTLDVRMVNGDVHIARIPAEDMLSGAKVATAIKREAGPDFTIEAKMLENLVPAIETLSKNIVRRREIAHTGWLETEDGLVYCTPGGTVGNLPAGVTVAMPKDLKLDRYSVRDDGDEAFREGIEGLLRFLTAFPHPITYPALAFALTPIVARWLPNHKFLMHLAGETGSLKTESAKTLMSLYGGKFVITAPLTNWGSTVNYIEQLGFWLPDVLGLVDDYKPILVPNWEFTRLVQRYAEGNDRGRLSRNVKAMQRQAMRWWLLSTGEDLPTGESSVRARMVTLRFPRRPLDAPENANLRAAQRAAKNFPTVSARWAAWMAANHKDLAIEGFIRPRTEKIAKAVQERVETPNVGRIAQNVATLWVVWDAFCDFLQEGLQSKSGNAERMKKEFEQIAFELAIGQAHGVAGEKPTSVFLGALIEGLDAGRWKLLPRVAQGVEEAGMGTAGWYDSEGVYLLPEVVKDILKRFREAGLQAGFTQAELFRLIVEEGLLVRKDKDAATTGVLIGAQMTKRTKRVLFFKPGVIPSPDDNSD